MLGLKFNNYNSDKNNNNRLLELIEMHKQINTTSKEMILKKELILRFRTYEKQNNIIRNRMDIN